MSPGRPTSRCRLHREIVVSRAHCRFCQTDAGEVVLDLGRQPSCEYFPPIGDPGPDPLFPVRLWLCAGCGLAQLADDDVIFEQPEGVEPGALVQQRADAAGALDQLGLLPSGATFVEGSSPHGGSWAGELLARGMRPAADGTAADMVVDGAFGLMHAFDQRAALEALAGRVAPDGVLVFQFHTLDAIINLRQWNAIRSGHYAYYSATALRGMLSAVGLTMVSARGFPLYGTAEVPGTVMVVARRRGGADDSVDTLLASEARTGVRSPEVLRGLQASVGATVESIARSLRNAAVSGEAVYGYSAASRAVALLHLAGVDPTTLRGIADASPAKQGCRMPGTEIPVIRPGDLVAAAPDRVLLFVPDLLPEVRRALPQIERGGRWEICAP